METGAAPLTGSGGGVAPRLASGSGYALWAPLFVNYCKRHGLGSVLSKEIKEWTTLSAMVLQWEEAQDSALVEEMLKAGASGSSSSSSSSSKPKGDATDGVDPKRVALKRLVSSSERTYAVLFDVLPAELRAQVPGPEGYAFGLWSWLRAKFQSTEADSVGQLWLQWCELRMDEDEAYDAFRARANKLNELLMAAKQKIPPVLFATVMLDRLPTRYAAAVLALKAGGKLKDPATVDWDEVASFVNTHERIEQRSSDAGGGDRVAMSARGAWRKGSKETSNGRTKAKCYNCQKIGHFAIDCGATQSYGSTKESASAAMQREEYDEDQFAFSVRARIIESESDDETAVRTTASGNEKPAVRTTASGNGKFKMMARRTGGEPVSARPSPWLDRSLLHAKWADEWPVVDNTGVKKISGAASK